jgi:hypothetical protein
MKVAKLKNRFPDSHEALKAAGYVPIGTGKCRACPASMVWYRTPNGKNIPIDLDGKQAHFATCPARQQFKTKKEKD